MYLYAGGLGEAWNWPHQGVSEVANDLNGYLINLYRVLQDPRLFERLRRTLAAVPFSRIEWTDADETMQRLLKKVRPEAYDPKRPDVTLAALFFVWNRQSRAGQMDGFTPLTRARTRGGRNAEVNAWWGSIDGLPEAKARLDNFVIEHDDALLVLDREDTADTLFYLDPTYLMGEAPGEGRTTPDTYHVESNLAHHEALLARLLAGVRGKVMLSGYPSKLYAAKLTKKAGWRCVTKRIDNKVQQGKTKRVMTEALWLNYP